MGQLIVLGIAEHMQCLFLYEHARVLPWGLIEYICRRHDFVTVVLVRVL